jgi:hypothetical protein
MPDVTIAYLVEPFKMPALHVEGLQLEPEEVTAIRNEIEQSYAEISKTTSGRFTFHSEQSNKIHDIEFEYRVKKHELSGRDRSIYFHAESQQEYEPSTAPDDRWTFICQLTNTGKSAHDTELLLSDLHKKLADPIFRYALLGKLVSRSLQDTADNESNNEFRRIIGYLSLIDRDIEMIERNALSIMAKFNDRRPRRRMIYERKNGCRCNLFRIRQ